MRTYYSPPAPTQDELEMLKHIRSVKGLFAPLAPRSEALCRDLLGKGLLCYIKTNAEAGYRIKAD